MVMLHLHSGGREKECWSSASFLFTIPSAAPAHALVLSTIKVSSPTSMSQSYIIPSKDPWPQACVIIDFGYCHVDNINYQAC